MKLFKDKQILLNDLSAIWTLIKKEGRQIAKAQKELECYIRAAIIKHQNFESALAYCLANKLNSPDLESAVINQIALNSYASTKKLTDCAYLDIIAVTERDPACSRYIEPLLFFKGFQALQSYRLSNHLYMTGNKDLAFFLQMRSSAVFGVDIHPNAKVGLSIMIDHAHSIVIGETAVIGNNVSLLHSVTLGGTGKDKGDRHPKIGDGVLIGTGASVLGNISIGKCSKIASGSVVLADVPDFKTVAGVPARVVGTSGCDEPSSEMDQNLS